MIDLMNRKLQQMHSALRGVRDADLTGIRPEISVTPDHLYVEVDFNSGSDPIDLANRASLLIANISSIKDHLKFWCKSSGATFRGEELINSNRSVALIYDLWNVDKHAELDRKPRSGIYPRLSELRMVMTISAGGSSGGAAFFSMDPRTGEISTGTAGGGSVERVLSGSILNERNEVVGDFVSTCQQAVDAWAQELQAAGVMAR